MNKALKKGTPAPSTSEFRDDQLCLMSLKFKKSEYLFGNNMAMI
jgi:hypothetical protein